jgi:hypothetical protein
VGELRLLGRLDVPIVVEEARLLGTFGTAVLSRFLVDLALNTVEDPLDEADIASCCRRPMRGVGQEVRVRSPTNTW